MAGRLPDVAKSHPGVKGGGDDEGMMLLVVSSHLSGEVVEDFPGHVAL